MKTLERAINEQQKIFLKRGNIEAQTSKVGNHLVQLPSDKISAICVLHLMKELFKTFNRENSLYKEEYNDVNVKKEVEFFNRQETKVPALNMYLDLGALFEKELSQIRH